MFIGNKEKVLSTEAHILWFVEVCIVITNGLETKTGATCKNVALSLLVVLFLNENYR